MQKEDEGKRFLLRLELGGKPARAAGIVNNSNVPHGFWQYWHENGEKMAEGWLKHGKPHGRWIVWDASGRKRSESSWRQGAPVGRWVTYNKDGEVHRLIDHRPQQPAAFAVSGPQEVV